MTCCALASLLFWPTVVRGAPPRLVVVIVLDQFPREYLDRFAPLFDKAGFRRLLTGGADFRSCEQDQFITLTGPGHAVMLTGAYGVHNGIVGNWWYSRTKQKIVSCVKDSRFSLVVPPDPLFPADRPRGASPLASMATTVGDVLRSATALRARVLSLSIKDRGAVLLGGRRPSGAYWYEPRTCSFVTSSYYSSRLADWVIDFDRAQPCGRYVGHLWTKLRPDLDYGHFADADDVPYERDEYGLGRTFPHPVGEWIKPTADRGAGDQNRYTAVVDTPFGNELLLRFAEVAVDGEQLGRDAVPDLLTLSFSSVDNVGHLYGPHSQEMLDTVLRMDRLLADFMHFLDAKVGRQQWVLVLTSDHGVAPIPERLERLGILPARANHYRFKTKHAREQVEGALKQRFFGAAGPPKDFPGFFEAWNRRTEPFVYVNHRALNRLPGQMSFDRLLDAIKKEIGKLDGVARVYSRSERGLLAASQDPTEQRAYRSWPAENGGDLLIQLQSYWVGRQAATTHGTPYRYDTHVPMLLYGRGISAGHFDRPVAVVDLASTVARILAVEPPPLDEGRPLFEALK